MTDVRRRAALLVLPFVGGTAYAQTSGGGVHPSSIAAAIKANIKWFNPVADYGCPTDGKAACDTAFANMMADVRANGGGVIWVPYNADGYNFTGATGWTINAYGLPAGIKVHLNGNTFRHSGSGVFLDIPSNYFPKTGDGFRRSVVVHGEGATIIGTSVGTAGVRVTECMFCQVDYLYIQGYATGTAFLGRVVADGNYCENLQLTRVAANTCKTSFAFTSPAHHSSFDGIYLKDLIAGNGGIANGVLFNFDCLISRGCIINCGGFYNAQGSVGFRFNGRMISTPIIGPWIDTAGGGTASPSTDMTFGPNYAGDPNYIVHVVDAGFINLPVSWWDRITVSGAQGYSTYRQFYDAAEVARMLFIRAHAPSGIGAGSQLVNFNTVQGGDFYTLDFNGNHVFNGGGVGNVRFVNAFGYGGATGVGGKAVQAQDKSTAVTLNKVSGQIVMSGAALAAGGKVSFDVANSTVAPTDVVVVAVAAGGTANAYRAAVTAVGTGSFTVTVENITGGSLAESPVINFNVIKGTNG